MKYDNKPIRWGILGPGRIAHKFCADLLKVSDARIMAVGSRSLERAEAFAQFYNIPNAYGSYEALAQSVEVDVIYIATPHNSHHPNTLNCLTHDKHVLCEKPMGINAEQVLAMIQAAEVRNLFLMEAIWTAFFPAIAQVQTLISNGTIGPIKMIEADFGFTAAVEPDHRLYNPNLTGGALLDIGIYPVFLAHLLKGPPDQIHAQATMTDTAVDGSTTIQMSWSDGTHGELNSTILADTPITATISGPKGYIQLHRRWHECREVSLYNKSGQVDRWTYPDEHHGYVYEIEEVHRCLRTGHQESTVLSHQFSLGLIRSLDEVRRIIGLKYPSE